MSSDPPTAPAPDWAAGSGDIWSRHWRQTDTALEGISPHLLSAILAQAPAGAFDAFDIGCGPGSTTIAVADACPQARIVACDISPSLAEVARQRTAAGNTIRVIVGDAEAVAQAEGPFDLLFSRHGVMFFADPVRAFGAFRRAAKPGGALVFSCFQRWESNPWASQLASAAADREVQAPGREPTGFAFADPDHVLDILTRSGWGEAEAEPIDFDYVAARDEALSFFSQLGPAARLLESMPEEERGAALARMSRVIEQHVSGTDVVFPAAAWVWKAKAAAS